VLAQLLLNELLSLNSSDRIAPFNYLVFVI